MANTRPSGMTIGSPDSPVIQEVVEIDGRGRFRAQQRWTAKLAWWPQGDEQTLVLMVLREPGLIELRDWKTDGVRVTAALEELRNQDDDEALENLRLLADKYRLLHFDSGSVAHLGDAALAHFGFPIARGLKHNLYVAVFPRHLALLSPAYRDNKLLEGSRFLDDLP
jgi:hypothetical protein